MRDSRHRSEEETWVDRVQGAMDTLVGIFSPRRKAWREYYRAASQLSAYVGALSRKYSR